MDRINRILRNPIYKKYLIRNAAAEVNRVFCHHDLTHTIDVSRVAYILSLEEGLGLAKDIIFAAGLLHDIGRWQEYAEGLDHAISSAKLALEILQECGYSQTETDQICQAIKDHRAGAHPEMDLNRILYRSDKISRPCTHCPALDACKRFAADDEPVLCY